VEWPNPHGKPQTVDSTTIAHMVCQDFGSVDWQICAPSPCFNLGFSHYGCNFLEKNSNSKNHYNDDLYMSLNQSTSGLVKTKSSTQSWGTTNKIGASSGLNSAPSTTVGGAVESNPSLRYPGPIYRS